MIKNIQKDFIRELSIWQQEIEVDANYTVLPRVLGIPCRVFFFVIDRTGTCTAYRLARERKQLPQRYMALARRKGHARKMFQRYSRLATSIPRVARRHSRHPALCTVNDIAALRKMLLDIWPAYLYGYNISRYVEKGLFFPASKSEQENVQWARRLHYALEGIYDIVETMLDTVLRKKVRNRRIGKQWRQITTSELLSAIEHGEMPSLRSPITIVGRDGCQVVSPRGYLRKKRYWVPRVTSVQTGALRGLVVFPGKVQGAVHKVSKLRPRTIKQFKRGSIFVALSVSPSLFIAAKKARAIVTDQGGQMSHAAILAREHKIPCIVGTQSATKVFKDGDKVEVDATKGVVRKL